MRLDMPRATPARYMACSCTNESPTTKQSSVQISDSTTGFSDEQSVRFDLQQLAGTWRKKDSKDGTEVARKFILTLIL